MRWIAPIAVAIAAIDQLTKLLVVRVVGVDEKRVVVDNFFNLVCFGNTGAAWGIFRDYNTLLAVISILTILVLYLLRHSFQLQRKSSCVALGLIAGGIAGNLIDRVRVGHVIDFLDFYVGRHHWPAFNVADSAICIGVVLYVIISWRSDSDAKAVDARA